MKVVKPGSKKDNVSLVIPVYNEEKTLGIIIRAAKKADYIGEVIIVDDGSTDNSRAIAEQEGAKVIAHDSNQGKGKTLKTGVSQCSGKYVLFMDADIRNIADVDTKTDKIYLNPKKLNLLTEPLVFGKADMVKATFDRTGGRVTELVAKPLIQMFFPEVEFSQPLAGEFGLALEHLENIELEDDWGVDSGLLIDAVVQGLNVKEVFIGFRDHPSKPLLGLRDMAYQVSRAILQRAIKYDRLNEDTKITEFKKIEAQYLGAA
jgi:glycosyltransferase involved in cell wall biosynthesis